MRNRYKLVLTLAFPYVITVLFPIISLICLGSMVTANYHEKIVIDRQNSIESAFERFCQRMQNVETLSYMIASNEIIVSYTYDCLRELDVSVAEGIKIKDLLGSFQVNSDVTDLFLYDPNSNRIISSASGYSDAEMYFRFFYVLDGFSLEQSVERLKAFSKGYEYSSCMKANLDLKETEVIEYRLSVPLARVVKESQPQLVLVLETENIMKDLFDVLEANDEFYLYDNTGRLIYGKGMQYEGLLDTEETMDLQTVNGRDKIYGMVCNSSNREWNMKVYIPQLMERSGSDTTTRYAWLLMGVSLVVSTLLSMYFTFRNHREIQEILGILKGQKEFFHEKSRSDVGYRVIKQYANSLIRENHQMTERIPKLENSQRYEVFDKLLRNTYEHQEGLDLPTGKCIVLCIRYKGSSYRTFICENITVKDFVKDLLAQIIEQKFEILDTASRETVCVISMGENDYQIMAEDIVSRLNVEISYHYKIEVEIGVGNVVESVYQISESFQQAKAVLRYRESSGKNIHFYTEMIGVDDAYYFPKEFDEKIYNYVVVGQVDKAKELIQRIYQENFEENDWIIMPGVSESIKSRLKDILILLAGKYDIHLEQQVELGCEQSVISFFKAVYMSVDWIAEEIRNKKKDVQQHTALKIMQYINENFCDNQLSLKQIAQNMGLHENYTSDLFRGEYGEPISVVIEKKRMEKACKLIQNTDMKVSEIAALVGYSSDGSFRRAFKKIMGMSPGEYRSKE